MKENFTQNEMSIGQVMAEAGEALEVLKRTSGPRVEILGLPTDTHALSETLEMGLCLPMETLAVLAHMSGILGQIKSPSVKITLNGKDFPEVENLLLHESFEHASDNGLVLPEGESGMFSPSHEGRDYRPLSQSFLSNHLTSLLNQRELSTESCDKLDITVSAAGVAFTGHEEHTGYTNTLLLPASQLPQLVSRARASVSLNDDEVSGPSM